jgi:hypothetical protein
MAPSIYRRPADHFAGANVPVKETLQVVPYNHQHVVGVTMSVSQSTGEVLIRPNQLRAWVKGPQQTP